MKAEWILSFCIGACSKKLYEIFLLILKEKVF